MPGELQPSAWCLSGPCATCSFPSPCRRHFDVVVACEDEEGEDLDVPLVSIRFR